MAQRLAAEERGMRSLPCQHEHHAKEDQAEPEDQDQARRRRATTWSSTQTGRRRYDPLTRNPHDFHRFVSSPQ